jgi:hypothetical protein
MSPFASALKDLLDNNGAYDRSDWSYILDTPLEQIESWVEDTTCPRPHHLGMIFTCVDRASDTNKEVSAKFKAVCQERSTLVSPFGKRMLPTVWEYFNRPAISELSSKLAKLRPDQQEKMLEEMYK